MMFFLRRTRFTDARLIVETHSPETVLAAFWVAVKAGEIVQLVNTEGKALKPVVALKDWPRLRRYNDRRKHCKSRG